MIQFAKNSKEVRYILKDDCLHEYNEKQNITQSALFQNPIKKSGKIDTPSTHVMYETGIIKMKIRKIKLSTCVTRYHMLDGVMVSVLFTSVEDHGFDSWSCKTK